MWKRTIAAAGSALNSGLCREKENSWARSSQQNPHLWCCPSQCRSFDGADFFFFQPDTFSRHRCKKLSG